MIIWAIGFLFTLGYIEGTHPETKAPWWGVCILVFAWPLALGAFMSPNQSDDDTEDEEKKETTNGT